MNRAACAVVICNRGILHCLWCLVESVFYGVKLSEVNGQAEQRKAEQSEGE